MNTLSRTAAARALAPTVRAGALLLAGALPFLLLHAEHQPAFALGRVDVKASDLLLLAIAIAAAVALRREPAIVRRWKPIVLPVAALMVWVLASVALAAASDRPYAAGDHLISALGFAQYGVLALAVPALIRTAADLRAVLWAFAGWLGVLDVVGVLQFAGLDWLTTSSAGERQPSLIGFHDLAAAGAAALAVGLVGVALGGRWPLGRLPVALCAGGAVALVLSGSLGGGAGLLGAAILVALVAALAGTLTRRRALALASITAATLLGIVALRGGDIEQFGRFLGVLPAERTTTEDVQTYSHRTLLAYFGLRVFTDHPVAGAGWQATNEYVTLEPYLADAHRRFPDVAEQSFPSAETPYGVQNGYIQALADLGVVGLLLFLAALTVPIALGALGAIRARGAEAGVLLAGAALVVTVAGVWTAQGLVAGLPMDALAWLGAGLVVRGRTGLEP